MCRLPTDNQLIVRHKVQYKIIRFIAKNRKETVYLVNKSLKSLNIHLSRITVVPLNKSSSYNI